MKANNTRKISTNDFAKKVGNVILLLFFLIISSNLVQAQNCSCISGKMNKEKSSETISGIATSKDFYSLLISKELNYADTIIEAKYFLSLVAASRVLLTDSMLQTKGKINLKLRDNTEMLIDNVKYMNNPLGFQGALGFQATITEEQVKTLSTNPIITLIVPEIHLTTDFSSKKQKEQQKIYTCLINRQRK